MMEALSSGYRFPWSFTKAYLRPSHYWSAIRHWYQRAARGYSDRDLWSFDYHLAAILISALPHYKNDAPGNWHMNMVRDDHDRYMRTAMGEEPAWPKEEEAAAMARWDGMIDGMVAGLKRVYDNDDVADSMGEEAYADARRAMTRFAEHFGAFWF